MISRADFFDYAEKHNLVIWSKQCSDQAMKTIEKLEKIEQIIKKHDQERRPEDFEMAEEFFCINQIKETLNE